MNKQELRLSVQHWLDHGTHIYRQSDHFMKAKYPRLFTKLHHLALCESKTFSHVLYDYLYPSPRCLTCGSHELEFKNLRSGYMKHCSRKCTQEDPAVRDKFRSSMLEAHGVEYTGQSPALRKKMNTTLESNYGPLGRKHPLIRQRAEQTTFERYGVKHIMQDREKCEANLQKCHLARKFKLSGKIFSVRGFEPHAIKWIHVSKGIPVEHILTTANEGVPSIDYVYNRSSHVYHPDMFVKIGRRWTLIEVKSVYTAGIKRDKSGWFSLLKRKAKACVDSGYRFKVVIVTGKGRNPKFCVVNDVHLKKRREVLDQVRALRHS